MLTWWARPHAKARKEGRDRSTSLGHGKVVKGGVWRSLPARNPSNEKRSSPFRGLGMLWDGWVNGWIGRTICRMSVGLGFVEWQYLL